MKSSHDLMENGIHAPTLRLERTALHTARHYLQDTARAPGSFAFSAPTNGRSSVCAAADESERPLAPKAPHFAPKVKNVIFLSMSGGPPHLDLFDYKPELVRR